MNKFIRIVLIIAVWATVTWIFREKLLPLPRPDSRPPPHFRQEAVGTPSSPHRATTLEAPPSQEAPVVASASRTGTDDLKLVKGIGPVYEHRLAQAGITSFEQLLDADAAEVADTIDASESQVLEWIGQARELSD